ncbi:MAG: hypothetical protein HYR85_13080 [Planctomycetes bacterium]|nr:hypothetical protein [Planctomycetota bacterium]MBI3843554.1 hypothetical protein [Planctomycetota bacterium]
MPTKSKAAPKSGVSRSQAIRVYLSAHPNAMPMDVQAALKAKGVIVTTGLVGVIKNEMKTKKADAAKAIARPGGRPRAASSNRHLRAEDILEAKRFVERVGGVGAATKALDLLAQLG